MQSTVVLVTGHHPRHSVLGIAWTWVTAVVMFALAAALGWWWADPAAGYVLVF